MVSGIAERPLCAGHHDSITGDYSPSSAGDAGTLVLEITAVPEPGSWAMLAAGLGLLGWLARRRRLSAPA